MEIDKILYSEIKNYCQLNGLKITPFINKLLKEAFNKEKYGEKPLFLQEKEKCNISRNAIDKLNEEYTGINNEDIEKKETKIINNTIISDNKIKRRKLN